MMTTDFRKSNNIKEVFVTTKTITYRIKFRKIRRQRKTNSFFKTRYPPGSGRGINLYTTCVVLSSYSLN